MRKILTSRQMRECDHSTIAHGTPSAVLMQRAGNAVYKVLKDNFDLSNVLVICGSGNNGGDGFIVALNLKRSFEKCEIWYVGEDHGMTEECEKRYNECIDEKITFVDDPIIDEYSVVVDAIFGIGLSSSPRGLAKAAIEAVSASDVPVISVDIPSGICSDTGDNLGTHITADITVAIQAYKVGHVRSDGINASGRVICADIGIDTSYAIATDSVIPDSAGAEDLSVIPKRKRDSHKGNFGRVLVIAGSKSMCGAAYLAAAAAYRAGAGIVEIFTHKENKIPLCTLLPEAIVTTYDESIVSDSEPLFSALGRATVVIIGPGIGTDNEAKHLVKSTYEFSNAPIIADADALNVTAIEKIPFPTEVPVIVTPHPMELSRLTGIGVKELLKNTWSNTVEYAIQNDIICVSKFARSVISDGNAVYVNTSGGPSLAKGGSGDVLTGIIAGMLCSGISPIEAAVIGTFVHGRAGDISSFKYGEISPVARDVIEAIPFALKNNGGKE